MHDFIWSGVMFRYSQAAGFMLNAICINPLYRTPSPSEFAISSIFEEARPPFNAELELTISRAGELKNSLSSPVPLEYASQRFCKIIR